MSSYFDAILKKLRKKWYPERAETLGEALLQAIPYDNYKKLKYMLNHVEFKDCKTLTISLYQLLGHKWVQKLVEKNILQEVKRSPRNQKILFTDNLVQQYESHDLQVLSIILECQPCNEDEDDPDTPCPICLSDINTLPQCKLECGHVFHASCIYKCSKKKVMNLSVFCIHIPCPMCRCPSKEMATDMVCLNVNTFYKDKWENVIN